MDINKHKFLMLRILKDIFTDTRLAPLLAFKGGTSLMFFYGLPRFSTDLDFNLLDRTKEQAVFDKVAAILSKYGTVADSNMKFNGPIAVLDYGVGERKLKVEISNREYGNHYEMKNLSGIDMTLMQKPDMFAHKLCALLDRKGITWRDVYDCYFFLSNNTPINQDIVEYRMGKPLADYLQDCIEALRKYSDKAIMSDIGELLTEKDKDFVRTKMRTETISLLGFFKDYPLIAEYPDSKMHVEAAAVYEQGDGKFAVRATIDSREYPGKEMAGSDAQAFKELGKESEQEAFGKLMAKKYFIKEWNMNNGHRDSVKK
mgnify:FL=1